MVRNVRVLALGMATALPFALGAQATDSASATKATVPTTPRECVEELRAYRMAQIFAIGYFDAPYIPKKDIEQKVSVRAKDCENRFPLEQVSGKQLDALASIYAIGHDDAKAVEIFEKRLAEPNISVRDKGLAYAAAVQSFADHDLPDRIQTAEKYMKLLDGLPMDVSGQEAALAHSILGNTYRLIGKGAEEIAHDKKALVIAQKLTQQERAQLLDELISTYGDLAEAYVGMPNAKAEIDSIADIAMHPTAQGGDVFYVKEGLDKAVKRGYLLGKTAPNLTSNHWFNVQAPPNGIMELKGNVPHIVEFTQFG
jgi:tetratricopeptide (TPR) repeat protein